MRLSIPRVHRWHEAGNHLYGHGNITHESVPVHIWLIGRWFLLIEEAFGHSRLSERLLGPIWRKFLPDYGDPLCFAMCFGWFRIEEKYTRTEHRFEVGWELLSPEYKAWYMKDRED